MSKRNKPLRHRLRTLVAVAVFGAVLIVTSSSIWRETAQFRANEYADLRASANVYGAALASPIADGKSDILIEALQPIAEIPSVKYISITDNNGQLLKEMGRKQRSAFNAGNDKFAFLSFLRFLTASSTMTSVPITHAGEPIATLTIHAQAAELSGGLGLVFFDVLVAAIFAGGIGNLIAVKVQRNITNPLHALADTMTKIRDSGNFSLRASATKNDETKQLADTFNELLDQLEDREAKLQANQNELRKLVQKRAKEVKQTKANAAAIDKAKSDFIATMSHEIRTPMNGVIGMANLLSNSRLPFRQKRYAEIIAKSGHGLLAIINDILDFSKIEAGRLEVENISIRPAEIVDDIVGLFWERAASKDLDFAAYIAPNVPETIEGDPVRIRQVVSNFVNNALKFTEKGHVVVSAKFAAPENGQGVIEFSVADTGVGIPDEKLPTIFEAFSQADQTTTRRFGGTGLGLAICKRLAEAMQGSIGVSSVDGKGSKFYFSFPTVAVDQPRPAVKFSSKKTALVALEGTVTRKLLARYLEEAGLTPVIIDPSAPNAKRIAKADMIFASPEFYDIAMEAHDTAPEDWNATRICICELGHAGLDPLLDSNIAEDVLTSPLSRREAMGLLRRIRDGKLRGKSALSYSDNETAPTKMFDGQHILAADDGAVNREVVKEALSYLNLKVTLVSNGEEALAAATENQFDLILMDCSMPKMDGFEATIAIRSLEESEGRTPAPIIALTAHVSDDEKTWRKAGMDGYLTKPFTIDALADEIGAHLSEGQAYAENAASVTGELVDRTSEDASETISDATTSRSHTLPASADPDEPFDVRVLDQLSDMQKDGADLPLRALKLFQKHSREAMLRLIDSPETKDHQEIASAAHALKSMSLSIGAQKLARTCSVIEASARKKAPIRELSMLIKTSGKDFREAQSALPSIVERYWRNIA